MNKKNKERRDEELANFDSLVDKAQEEKSIITIKKRNELLDKTFDMTSDLQLQNASMNATATSTNKDEALKKYWFCNGKCKYSFTQEDFDWTANIQEILVL